MEKLRAALQDFELGEVTDRILQFAKNSIRAIATPTIENEIQIGQSKIGGAPDVPTDFIWPQTNDQHPLYFLCQLNLAEIKPFDSSNLLPAKGLLSFFYDAERQPWGYDPNNYDGFRVVHFTEEKLQRMEQPSILRERIDSAILHFKNEWTLPDWESPDGQILTDLLTEEQEEAYNDFLFDWVDEEETEQTTHRIDGHPNTIQGDMYLQCQLVTNGLYCGDSTGYEHPLRKELEPQAKDWRLLLQLDSEDDLGYMWGDSGKLYFWIREQDCQNKAFDKVWTILQCY
ncbi:YwqG family protein [Metasolibacillus sp.]|uniref:YwqG family protein n=1 Tax=Metasolibacillus sp. TaxID=2703680 RepID=UPI0025FE2013|nr:YwqG family protein [Metasolibacillus sp.]MCT6922885.1 YwqG family protein [Metasolibacillus sp.]MCT6939123.1 YwqG family protein [Metasolibacillus sp.]